MELSLRRDLQDHEISEILTDVLSNRLEASSESQKIQLEHYNKLAKQLEALNAKVSDRQRIQDNLQTSLNKKREEATKVYDKHSLSLQKLTSLQESQAGLAAEARTAKASHALAQERLKRDSETLEKVGALGRSIAATKLLLKEGSQIKVTGNINEWVTREIYIKDESGSYLPVNFGNFEIYLQLKESGVLKAEMHPQNPVPRCGKAHPHVLMSGEPCLGNVGKILLKNMEVMSVGLCIEIVDRFLTHYNPLDPYLKLSYWGPSTFHTPLCECGIRLLTECPCQRCTSCTTLVVKDDDDNKYPFKVVKNSSKGCSQCTACCDVSHKQLASADELVLLDGMGINGSSCFAEHALLLDARHLGTDTLLFQGAQTDLCTTETDQSTQNS